MFLILTTTFSEKYKINYIFFIKLYLLYNNFIMFQRKTDTSPATGNVSNVTNESPTRI